MLAVVLTVASASGDFVRVKVKTANVRLRAGVGYPVLRQVHENAPLRVLERQGEWLKIGDLEGREGWIFGPLADTKPAPHVGNRCRAFRGHLVRSRRRGTERDPPLSRARARDR
ncbi:MAG: SH3 domain-containing protein, partial [Candidatus Methylomirabilia bacterium]